MFRKHVVQLRSNNMSSDRLVQLISLRSLDYSDEGTADSPVGTNYADTTDVGNDMLGSVPVGERYMNFAGPVTVHGYSVQVFGTFFGVVYQGLSNYDYSDLDEDANDSKTHDFPSVITSTVDGSSDGPWVRLNNVKNLKFLRGWRQDPVNALTQDDNPRFQSTTLGSCHLQKKFTRKSFKHRSKGLYKKTTKSGLVMVPNSPTEYMSFNIKNLQMVEESGSSDEDGFFWARVTVWISYDAIGH